MLISPSLSPEDKFEDVIGAACQAWERAVLHDLVNPADAVLELEAGAHWLTTTLAARTGWVTAVESSSERLAHLREIVGHSGWPNITLVPQLLTARVSRQFDVVVAPWLVSDLPNLRWLTQLAERRLLLTSPYAPEDDCVLDQLRTSAQALGLDVSVYSVRFENAGRRVVLAIDLP